jgi:periplasmic protein TonB
MRLIAVMIIINMIAAFQLIAQSYVPSRPLSEANLIKSFISSHMVYPSDEYEQRKQGTVALSFAVLSDGSIHDIKITRSVSESLDNEAIRLVRKIIWQPARLNGMPIEELHEYFVKFDVRHYDKVRKKMQEKPDCWHSLKADTSAYLYPISSIETLPEPLIPGGQKKITAYLREHLRYPDAAFRLNLSGTVTLGFVAEPDGTLTNIHVIKAVGGGCEQEAIRIIRDICWKPASINGIDVRSKHTFDIQFKLDDDTRKNHIPNRQSGGI